MSVLPKIEASKAELVAIFKDLHAHPELGFEEFRTAGIVAHHLRDWGVDEVHEGIGGTGVVGLVRGRGRGNRRIGLRADMDALPIEEKTGLAYASTYQGKMHACGHDSHTTMLLGAAKYLAATRNFDGTAVLIFQPAEEGLGGARKMLAEGLFERFPCDEIYGMHNAPNGRPGTLGIAPGPAMSGAAFFDISVRGKGSHGAMPHESRDPVVIAAALVGQLQTVVSRNVPPLDSCVLSVTMINGGTAYNVIPDTVTLAGTLRYFRDDVCELAQVRARQICEGFALAHQVSIDIEFRNIFNVLNNDAELSNAYMDAAADIVGEANIDRNREPATGSEDFADMLLAVPGAYCTIGHGGTIPVHNPEFIIDPDMLPVGASVLARLVERRLPLEGEIA